jgi:Uma2 family endonuclease
MSVMASVTRTMTVEEFRRLPEDSGPVYHELRHGEPFAVTRPKLKHFLIQRNLRELLTPYAESGSCVDTEVAYRPFPEYELWVADVAYVSAERFREADPDDNIRGAPELVVEVLSPSNSVAEIHEKVGICLANGSREFWVVDPDRAHVKVNTPGGHTVTWQVDDEIPVPFGNQAKLKAADILRQNTR